MQHLTRDELKSLLTVAKSKSKRNWLMILVAFWHGLRASEVISMKGSQIKDGYITVARLKGSLKTVHPLVNDSDEVFNERAELEAWAAEVGSGLMFPLTRVRFWQLMKQYGKEAGIPAHKNHPHVLKHTTAMLTIQKAGIENVRAYLGHKSIGSTGAYLKVDDETASKAIAAAIGGN